MIIDDRARAALPERILLAVVVALLLLRLATLAAGLRAPARTQVAAQPPQLAAPQLPAAGALLDAIRRANLFGAAAADGIPVQSSLQLVLTGTFAYADPQIGYAVLGEKPEGAVLRRVGDEVLPGAKLAQVFADHVVLERGGGREILALMRRDLAGATSAQSLLVAFAPPPPTPPDYVPEELMDPYNPPMTLNTGLRAGTPGARANN